MTEGAFINGALRGISEHRHIGLYDDARGGAPSGGLGGSGVGAWVGPRARALTTLPLTTHLAALESSLPPKLPPASARLAGYLH